MDTLEIKRQIDAIKDRIRHAPAHTPNMTIFEWYLEIDELEKQIKELEKQIKESEEEKEPVEDLSQGSEFI